MQYTYDPKDLVPLDILVDEDGDTHGIYNLPAPKRWLFKDDLTATAGVECMVRTVRVCICTSDPYVPSVAVVVPYNEDGREEPYHAVSFPGVTSVIGVLEQLGFTPSLMTN